MSSLEDQAVALARHIARDGLPPDAGAIAKLRGIVAQARQEGREAMRREVLGRLENEEVFLAGYHEHYQEHHAPVADCRYCTEASGS